MDSTVQQDEVEEEIFSKTRQNEYKIKEFKEFLASHDILLAYVKCPIFSFEKISKFFSLKSFGFSANCKGKA